ncbi:MAG TPA: hypothetical protein VFG24_08755 [Nitrosopumilaceae archaeon]|nr:hypothetical protein [Nitrosopumilaceae archaeon]
MKKTLHVAVLLFASLLVLSFSIQDAHATNFVLSDLASCQAIGGTWFPNSTTCSIGNLTINSGDTLTIASGVKLDVTLTLSNSGTITNSGTINSFAVTNSGTIQNAGAINNLGSTITNTGTIMNSGRINNSFYIDNTGSINNSGTIANIGIINNNSGGIIVNTGIINNNSGGTINNNSGGRINNNSVINNSGTITDSCGSSFHGNTVSGNPIIIACHSTGTKVVPNPVTTTVSKSIIFHAMVGDKSSTKTNPTGTVSWSDGGAGGSFSSGTCTLAPFGSSTSVSTCAITYTAPSTVGTVTITATYSGDSTHRTSVGTSTLTVS